MSIWIIEESPNPGIWNIVQSRGIYKRKERAEKAVREIVREHKENHGPESIYFNRPYRATEYVPKVAA